jgi:hypothetical protein
MADYYSVLNDALQLSEDERQKLRRILLVELHDRGVISHERFRAESHHQMPDDEVDSSRSE